MSLSLASPEIVSCCLLNEVENSAMPSNVVEACSSVDVCVHIMMYLQGRGDGRSIEIHI